MIFGRFGDRKGWTLIELMIAIGIIGILSAVTIPGYLSGMPLRRLKADTMDIASRLTYAKMNAVNRNTDVGVYFYPNEEAYCVFVDSDDNGAFDDPGDQILINNVELRAGVTFDRSSDDWTLDNAPINTIIFSPNGSAILASGTVVIVNDRNDVRKIIVASNTGRVRTE
jgi:prepilin-type N-terminal cleavage/methylation domain-containing protein